MDARSIAKALGGRETSGDRPTPAEHDAANAAVGFRFVRALAVEKAALDRELPPACTRVLAALSYFMNDKTKRAWPSYRTIADLTGYGQDTIDRTIRQLKSAGYLFTERRAPIAGGRALVHYGLGAIQPQDIQDMVAAAIKELRRRESGSADSAKKSGVSRKLTPPENAGSKADPAIFDASDSAILSPQEPLVDEPISSVSEGHSPDNIIDGEIVDATWRLLRLGRQSPSKPHPLPEDWEPGPEGLAYGIERGLSNEIIWQQWETFRDHHIGKNTKWARWDLAWQTWVRRAVEYRNSRLERAPSSKDEVGNRIEATRRAVFGGGNR